MRVMSVEDIKKALKSDLTTSGLEDADDTDVLQTDGGRDDVNIGAAELVPRQTISVLFVGPNKAADVT